MLRNMFKTNIIIPCFNEESRITTDEFLSFINCNQNVDFCFVNDGSSDNTFEILNALALNNPNRFSVLNLKVNVGKAEAVRQGILFVADTSKYDFIGFFDADLSTPLSEINHFLSVAENNNELMAIVGSRLKRLGANIQRSFKRHVLGRIFSTIATLLTGIPIYDSQCGAKIFKKELINSVFEKPFKSKWVFDLEIFIRIRNKFGDATFKKITLELPLYTWIEKGGSKFKLKHFIEIPFNLMIIYNHYNKNT